MTAHEHDEQTPLVIGEQTPSLRQEREEAEMLQTFWTALAADDMPATPRGLDPEVAVLARRLARDVRLPTPEPAFVAALQRRLIHGAVPLPVPHSPDGHATAGPRRRAANRSIVPPRWRPGAVVAALIGLTALLLAALGAALSAPLVPAVQPMTVSARTIVQRAVRASLGVVTGKDAVHSFTLSSTTTMQPGNSGLPAFDGYGGAVVSRVRRWYEAPNRWRIERRYGAPPRGYLAREYYAPGTQVSDGATLWSYDQPNHTVSVNPLRGESGTADLFPLGQSDAAPASGQPPRNVGGVLAEATRCFTPTLEGSAPVAGRDSYVIDLERVGCYSSSAHETDGRLVLWVDKQTFFVLKSVLYDVKDRARPYVTTVVTAVRYNVPIDPAVFTFTPPAGAVVDDQRPRPGDGKAPGAAEYRRQLAALAAQAPFPLFAPLAIPSGLTAEEPRRDDTVAGWGGVQLAYVRAARVAADSADPTSALRDGVSIVERAATPSDAASDHGPAAQAVRIGGLSGWYQLAVTVAPGKGTGSAVSFIRDGTLVLLSGASLSRAAALRLASALVAVPGGHAPLLLPAPPSVASLRKRLPYPLFVPTRVPAGLTRRRPVERAGGREAPVVELDYEDAAGVVALIVLEGSTGCCIDANPNLIGQPVRLANGVMAHPLPNEARFGGPILWWEQDGTYISVSGPHLTFAQESAIAVSMSRTAP